MVIDVNNDISTLKAQEHLKQSQQALGKSYQNRSNSFRNNIAKDKAKGFNISENADKESEKLTQDTLQISPEALEKSKELKTGSSGIQSREQDGPAADKTSEKIASKTAKLTKDQILQKMGASTLTQTNTQPQKGLSLLG